MAVEAPGNPIPVHRSFYQKPLTFTLQPGLQEGPLPLTWPNPVAESLLILEYIQKKHGHKNPTLAKHPHERAVPWIWAKF
ncbi:hypothetical protein AMTRI_Chr01g132480 [Amborella trichopoda]